MVCYHPLTAWRHKTYVNPQTGKSPIVFQMPPLLNYNSYEILTLPCGQCIGCRLERSRQWATRCLHEASLYEHNCFITLTFDNEHLSDDGSLLLKDYQDFMKRLRKKFGSGIRFFHCGEYGSLNQRPHHHAILFNHDFADKKLWSVRDGIKLYVSDDLSRLWPFGFSTVGDVTFESAAYVSRYILKKITGDSAQDHYQGRKPEYTTMSRRPGIGREWFLKYKNDIYPYDKCVVRPGMIARPPRYYDKIYDDINPSLMSVIKDKRKTNAKKFEAEQHDELRMSAKETVKKLSIKKLIRPIEI